MELTFSKRIASFIRLGEELSKNDTQAVLEENIQKQFISNPWFLPSFSRYALKSIQKMLSPEELMPLEAYYSKREGLNLEQRKKIAVISAGNIPLAGFHDFFCVLASGNDYLGKLSSHDNILLPALAGILTGLEPAFEERIRFTDKSLSGFDKIIATGSNNSARYFDYYFGKYPHILRRNRNSLAILSGTESEDQLAGLFRDMFLYFGLGCRSVSLLWVPEGYRFDTLISVIEKEGKEIAVHHRFCNNLDYQKTMHLMNQAPFVDTGISLLVEKKQLPSPIGIIHYQHYDSVGEVHSFIQQERENIQCIVTALPGFKNSVFFGEAQQPGIMEYADGVDSIQWAASPCE